MVLDGFFRAMYAAAIVVVVVCLVVGLGLGVLATKWLR